MVGHDTRCLCSHLKVFSEESPSRCVAVQMHNLQHKFLRCVLHRQTKRHASPNLNTRVSLVQAAMFYHHREAVDRRDKIVRLLELALGDLQDSGQIEELSTALAECRVEPDSIGAHIGR